MLATLRAANGYQPLIFHEIPSNKQAVIRHISSDLAGIGRARSDACKLLLEIE
jgi:hypothetical protein